MHRSFPTRGKKERGCAACLSTRMATPRDCTEMHLRLTLHNREVLFHRSKVALLDRATITHAHASTFAYQNTGTRIGSRRLIHTGNCPHTSPSSIFSFLLTSSGKLVELVAEQSNGHNGACLVYDTYLHAKLGEYTSKNRPRGSP